jgi:hypothetical protein
MIAWVGNPQFAKERTLHPALRQLCSIPSRPSRRTASLGHAGIARLRWRSLVAPLRFASSPFPPSPFEIWVRRAAGKDGAGFPSPSHMRLPQERKRARKGVRCVGINAIRIGSPSSSRAIRACAASVRLTRASVPPITPRIVRSIATARIVGERRAETFRHVHYTRSTTLRCKE